tara:strand:+ start:3402 stop:3860 length:459 start_codon:yes stop_codon:yes gene_type:complete
MRKFIFSDEHKTGGVTVVTVTSAEAVAYALENGLVTAEETPENAVEAFCCAFDAEEVLDPPYKESEHLSAQILMRVPGDLLTGSMLSSIDKYLLDKDASYCAPALAIQAVSLLRAACNEARYRLDHIKQGLSVVIDEDCSGTADTIPVLTSQ